MRTSDSFKGVLSLNEVCSHHRRTRGEVQGSRRLLIKTEHPAPVFRMHLKIQRGSAGSSSLNPNDHTSHIVSLCCGPWGSQPPSPALGRKLLGRRGGGGEALAGREAPSPARHSTQSLPWKAREERSPRIQMRRKPKAARPKCRGGT